MLLKNREYWRKRFEDLNESLLSESDGYISELESAYELAFSNIENDIRVFYQRFGDNNELTYAEAVKLLNSKERKAFQMTVDEYIKKGTENAVSLEWVKELENASTIYHIDRLKALQIQIRQQIEILEAKKLSDMESIFTNTYADGYYKSLYELHKGMGYGKAFALIDTNAIEKAFAMTYGKDGLNFSQRIWKDRNYLARTLETEFVQMIIRGEGPDRLINLLSKRFDTSKSAAANLVQTESAFLASNCRKDAMESLDVEEFEIVETLDIKTCDTCGALDGTHLPMNKFEPWVTAPPFHHRCRGTTVPYFPDYKNGERAARGADGKTYYVPESMAYKEWFKEHVESNPQFLAEKKKWDNRFSDKKQYERYTNILGKKQVGNFADFQNLKYNSNEWEQFKDYAKSIKIGEITPLANFNLYKQISREIDEKLIGITTSNGIVINSKAKHFIARVIGSVEEKRNGVSVDNCLKVLTSNQSEILPVRAMVNGNSQKFRYNGIEISINPDTGQLIQVNPRRR